MLGAKTPRLALKSFQGARGPRYLSSFVTGDLCHGRPATQHVCKSYSDDDDGADIDRLASFLSQEAAKLRQSFSDNEIKQLTGEQGISGELLATSLGFKSLEEEKQRVFAEVGEGGFDSNDFEILQQLGRISIQQQMAGSSESTEPTVAVIAYAARYDALGPYTRPPVMFLKEMLPPAWPLALNELLLLSRVQETRRRGEPLDRIMMATSPASTNPPFVPLLGYFTSAPSETACDLAGDSGDSLWLVYKWEALRPLSLYLQQVSRNSPTPTNVNPLTRMFSKDGGVGAAWQMRELMLRAITLGLLRALSYCHSRGVVHGSISAGSVVMSSCEDNDALNLLVKLDNFGFGRLHANADGSLRMSEDPLFKSGLRQDVQAAALLLLELYSTALGADQEARTLSAGNLAAAPGTAASPAVSRGAVGPAAGSGRTGLQRLLFDVFGDDVQQLRTYCQADPACARLVSFLDSGEGAGWSLLQRLVNAERMEPDVVDHPFLRAV